MFPVTGKNRNKLKLDLVWQDDRLAAFAPHAAQYDINIIQNQFRLPPDTRNNRPLLLRFLF